MSDFLVYLPAPVLQCQYLCFKGANLLFNVSDLLIEVMEKFPDQARCISHLESIQ
ncbi:MAG: hypothetical protein M2R45_01467 [Verrucomicrobia subdivision 3 bacterium]|nr:hypothetical protein [Limisphaerales bacterium]MCS1413403.1 hypothetical protein [Limisphaerales bacterium]